MVRRIVAPLVYQGLNLRFDTLISHKKAEIFFQCRRCFRRQRGLRGDFVNLKTRRINFLTQSSKALIEVRCVCMRVHSWLYVHICKCLCYTVFGKKKLMGQGKFQCMCVLNGALTFRAKKVLVSNLWTMILIGTRNNLIIQNRCWHHLKNLKINCLLDRSMVRYRVNILLRCKLHGPLLTPSLTVLASS
jgi:hypothetical protein